MNYPNMMPELFEAVHEYFKDESEVEADVLVFLGNLAGDFQMACKVASEAKATLTKLNRCDKCGMPLEQYHYLEKHTEVDDAVYEDMYEPYCPNCDVPHQMRMKDV